MQSEDVWEVAGVSFVDKLFCPGNGASLPDLETSTTWGPGPDHFLPLKLSNENRGQCGRSVPLLREK